MIKVLLKLFLFLGGSFTFLIFFWNLYSYKDLGLLWSLVATFYEGIFFAVFMTTILGLIHWTKVNSIKEKDDSNPYDVNQSDSFIIDLDIKSVFEKSKNILSDLKFTTNIVDSNNYKIRANNDLSWGSWGENILISLQEQSKEKTEVFINSKPRVFTNIIDNGKNLSNIKTIKKQFLKV